MAGENEVREEVPVAADKDCCFCIPLRKFGLTSWGYFKMGVSAFFILIITYALVRTCMMLGYIGNGNHRNRIHVDIAVTSVALTFFVTDLILTMPFIFGAHQPWLSSHRWRTREFAGFEWYKTARFTDFIAQPFSNYIGCWLPILPDRNEKLLRKFYVFSIVTWAVTILLSALAISISIECWLSRFMSAHSLAINLLQFSAYHAIIIVQTYFLFLLRGEVFKLGNNVGVPLVQSAVEAETSKIREEKAAADDTEINEE